jgi:hypothetical protein
MKLKFNNYTLDNIPISNGIGQGDPLLMILYQYYNTDLLDIPNSANESAIAYIDDTILIAIGADFLEVHKKLSNMMTRKGGAIDWSNTHNSHFKFSKLALMDFVHQNNKKQRELLTLLNTTLSPAACTKYLGVYLDQHLDWGTQQNYTVEKGTKWTAQIRHATAPS